ncbi:hypothetical protein FEDK69T_06350 [Flavobacterium enshiense DK69]|uniref:Uncharacterized protein n=1 Tax=Flavobacterium enshiense DK69 TaxID=1107311 RepID=V6SC13_9FLAO|nr:hypothetical protein [Flavobacterium enshiense]ESU24198.1 hypothetical protein FEDK69T_06350 [Flavobacterium enshiense DK69]KGO95425.1 hypothetical protein Q767_11525 [Flavobacterium enshiense DK69]
MKLTSEQIERLYQFTRQHYVEYYDLQTELTDHLANGIEAQWEQNPNLSFEEALQFEFKKFGIFGFMNVVEQRQAALTKKYHDLVWQHFKDFYKLPKIIGSLVAIVLLKLFLETISFSEELIITSFVAILLTFFGGMVYMKYKNRRKTRVSGKKWLFEEIVFGKGSFVGYIYVAICVFNKIPRHFENDYTIWIFSIMIVLMVLLEYIMLVKIPKKSEEYLITTYPEYKLT